MSLYGDDLFLLEWRGRTLAHRPRTGWASLLDEPELRTLLSERCDTEPAGLATWQRQRPFRPRALTVQLQHKCNLACSYCYLPPSEPVPLNRPAFEAAATSLIDGAVSRGEPAILGLHGCEPLVDVSTARWCVRTFRSLANERSAAARVHATTNGVLGEEALQLALSLDELTLSWDGPAKVHDAQRPRRDGSGTHASMQRTLNAWCAKGRTIRLRATVTRRSLPHVEHAIPAMVTQLPPGSIIQLEPVYLGLPGAGLHPDAPAPVDLLLAVLRLSQSLGDNRIEVAASRSNPHRRHCAPLQNNLLLRADGSLEDCFLGGSPDLADDVTCTGCIARNCCARGCPSACPSAGSLYQPELCVLSRGLTLARLLPDWTPSEIVDVASTRTERRVGVLR